MTTLHIKNMVCNRCILAMEQEVKVMGWTVKEMDLGKVVLNEKPTNEEIQTFKGAIEKIGFELIEDTDKKWVEAIKNAIIHLIYDQNEVLKKYTTSAFLEKELDKEYKWLSTLFSNEEKQTIEQFVIAQKVERVKELLSYQELSISEIAHKLHYSSIGHLSNQFKKTTGQTPSEFKNGGKRIALDKI